MMIDIKCPQCESTGKMSLVDSRYEGPYRCWKCRALFTLTIVNNAVHSCMPLSEEDLED